MHLLLVDDHPLFCVGFAHALQAARPGLLVEIAPTLQQGLDRAAEHGQFDIVLIDYRLGERNGIEGLRSVQGDGVFFVTAQDADTEIPKCMAAGFDGFIGKPISRSRFPKQIRRILSGEPVWETY